MSETESGRRTVLIGALVSSYGRTAPSVEGLTTDELERCLAACSAADDDSIDLSVDLDCAAIDLELRGL